MNHSIIPGYIDPGTGSMLFTILIGILGAAFYSIKMLFIKLRFKIGGGKVETENKIVAGVYDGFAKVFKMIYMIFYYIFSHCLIYFMNNMERVRR